MWYLGISMDNITTHCTQAHIWLLPVDIFAPLLPYTAVEQVLYTAYRKRKISCELFRRLKAHHLRIRSHTVCGDTQHKLCLQRTGEEKKKKKKWSKALPPTPLYQHCNNSAAEFISGTVVTNGVAAFNYTPGAAALAPLY